MKNSTKNLTGYVKNLSAFKLKNLTAFILFSKNLTAFILFSKNLTGFRRNLLAFKTPPFKKIINFFV